MAKFPEPPSAADLRRVPPEIRQLLAGTLLWRIYFRGGDHPTYWDSLRSYGPTQGRFDHHVPPPRVQERSILYAAAHGVTCLAEVFQASRHIDRSQRDPWLVGFRLQVTVELLDLTAAWPTRAGASMALNTGPRPRARRWARTIYEAYPNLGGLYYPSSMHANRPAMALTNRSVAAFPSQPTFHRPLTDPGLLYVLRNAGKELGYGLS